MLAARILVPPAPRDQLFTQLAARLADPDAERKVAVAKTAEDFYAEIWAKPKDDGPREVFADWLIEQGDPRGELIALQIARARGTAEPDGHQAGAQAARRARPDLARGRCRRS